MKIRGLEKLLVMFSGVKAFGKAQTRSSSANCYSVVAWQGLSFSWILSCPGSKNYQSMIFSNIKRLQSGQYMRWKGM